MANTSHQLEIIPQVNASELQAVCDTLETCRNTIEPSEPTDEVVTYNNLADSIKDGVNSI